MCEICYNGCQGAADSPLLCIIVPFQEEVPGDACPLAGGYLNSYEYYHGHKVAAR